MNTIQAGSNRDYILDSLRGLMLILMLIDHYPFFHPYTFQPFGIFSAAEGFFYLSGFVFGLVYSKYLGDIKLWIKCFERIRKMYIFHLIIFGIIMLEAILLKYSIHMELSFTPEWLQKDMVSKIFYFISFRYYPYLFNVIPIYFLFFIVSPFVLLAFKNNLAWIPLGIAAVLWFLSNNLTHPYQYLLLLGENAFYQLRAFNPMSWWFIFIIGSYFGYRKFKKKSLNYNRILIFIASLICIILFVARRIPELYQPDYLKLAINQEGRELMSPLRFLNFISFAYILSYLIQKHTLKRRNYLAFLGSYSINVFVFHIFIIYNIIKLTRLLENYLYIHFILIIISIWSLTIPAMIAENIKNQKKNPLFNFKAYFSLFPIEFLQIFQSIRKNQ